MLHRHEQRVRNTQKGERHRHRVEMSTSGETHRERVCVCGDGERRRNRYKGRKRSCSKRLSLRALTVRRRGSGGSGGGSGSHHGVIQQHGTARTQSPAAAEKNAGRPLWTDSHTHNTAQQAACGAMASTTLFSYLALSDINKNVRVRM
jgi:hypothetical protein